MKAPQRIELTTDQVDALLNRLKGSELSEEDRSLLSEVVQFSLWLQQGLEHSEINLAKLRHIFGILAEKKSLLT